MAQFKVEYNPFKTGLLVARFPHLSTPDTFKGKTQYKVGGVPQDKVSGVALKKEIEAFAKKTGCGPGRPLKKDKKDAGIVFFEFKSHRKPALFDAQGNPLPEGAVIGGGSIIRVAGSMATYEGFGGGITLYVDAVRVIDFKAGRDGDPFGDAEDGYVASGAEQRDPFGDDETTTAGDDSDDMDL